MDYDLIRSHVGDRLMSGNITFDRDNLLALMQGMKTQTTRDYMGWRWDRLCVEHAAGRSLLLVEESQYKRNILGVVEIRSATVRKLNAMNKSEWEKEGLQEMPLDVFAKRYLKATTPLDQGEYKTRSRWREKGGTKLSVRKVGVLGLGTFAPKEMVEAYGSE